MTTAPVGLVMKDCRPLRARVSSLTCLARQAEAKARHGQGRMMGFFEPCLGCTTWEGEGKMEATREEPRCSECGKAASEVRKFVAKRGQCKGCLDRAWRERQKAAAGSPAVERKPRPPRPVVEPETRTSRILLLDLTEYPEVFSRIQAVAKDELRTPEMQAVWMLKKAAELRMNGYPILCTQRGRGVFEYRLIQPTNEV